LASLNFGQPMITRLPSANFWWKSFSAIGAQSAAISRCAFSKNGALGGMRLNFTGHWGFCGVVGAVCGVVGVLVFRYSCTSCSLKASASRSIMVMAPCGQCPRHAPKPSQ